MLFITYANDDLDFVEELAERLREAGIEHWYDEARLSGAPIWSAAIEQRLLRADGLLLVMSPSCTASQYATFEWTSAHRAKLPIIPILCRRSLLHPALEGLTSYDFTRSSSRDWRGLTQALIAQFGKGTSAILLSDPDIIGAIDNPTDTNPAEISTPEEQALAEVAILADDVARDPQALVMLARVVATQSSAPVQNAAAKALLNAGMSKIFARVAVALQNADSATRLKAIQQLKLIEEPYALVFALNTLSEAENDTPLQLATLETIGHMRDPASIPALIRILEQDDDERLHKTAVDALIRLETKAAQALAEYLPGAVKKERIVKALIAIGKPAMIRPLIMELRNEYSPYQVMVARALAQIGKPALTDMIQIMKITSDPDQRLAILRALGRGRDPDMIDVFLDLLPGSNSETRAVIISALSNYGRAALPKLKNALVDLNWEVRDSAATILREMGYDPTQFGYEPRQY